MHVSPWMNIKAVKRAINEMPKDFAIKEFLIVNKEEVEGMLDTEFNEEEVWQMFQNDVDAERKRADEAEAERDEVKQQLKEALAELERLRTAAN